MPVRTAEGPVMLPTVVAHRRVATENCRDVSNFMELQSEPFRNRRYDETV